MDPLYDLIERCTTCPICLSTQFIPTFVTVDGGSILHASCAKTWLAQKPTRNLNNESIKCKIPIINVQANQMFRYGLKYTTVFNEEMKKIEIDNVKMFPINDVINFLLEIPKLILMIPRDVLNYILEHMDMYQVRQIPINIFYENFHMFQHMDQWSIAGRFHNDYVNYYDLTQQFFNKNLIVSADLAFDALNENIAEKHSTILSWAILKPHQMCVQRIVQHFFNNDESLILFHLIQHLEYKDIGPTLCAYLTSYLESLKYEIKPELKPAHDIFFEWATLNDCHDVIDILDKIKKTIQIKENEETKEIDETTETYVSIRNMLGIEKAVQVMDMINATGIKGIKRMEIIERIKGMCTKMEIIERLNHNRFIKTIDKIINTMEKEKVCKMVKIEWMEQTPTPTKTKAHKMAKNMLSLDSDDDNDDDCHNTHIHYNCDDECIHNTADLSKLKIVKLDDIITIYVNGKYYEILKQHIIPSRLIREYFKYSSNTFVCLDNIPNPDVLIHILQYLHHHNGLEHYMHEVTSSKSKKNKLLCGDPWDMQFIKDHKSDMHKIMETAGYLSIVPLVSLCNTYIRYISL